LQAIRNWYFHRTRADAWGCSLRKAKTVFVCLFLGLWVLLPSRASYSAACFPTEFVLDIETGADQPTDLAMAPDGRLYLVDGVNHRVIVLDGEGERKFTFGSKGDGKGKFNRPVGIDISRTGRVFISDTGNRRIQVFDLSGGFINMFPVKAGVGEKPSDPVDVLASGLKGNVFVSDNDNHKIRVYDQQGALQLEWGRFGEGPGMFRYPGIMAVDEFNHVYVVDVLNTRVQKFDPFGNFMTDIGSWGVLPGRLFRPKGVAIDKKNRIYVSDSYMGLIQVFAESGRFIGVLCEDDKRKRQFTTPVGMVIDNHRNRLHVVEMRANKVSVFRIPE
jgi:DNA-binding beta-propeller fold protein YncE